MGLEASAKPWLWAAAAVLLSSAPAFPVCDVPTIKGANVGGQVNDLAGGARHPLAAATVRLLDDSGKVVAEVRAGEDGRFSISPTKTGRYSLSVTAVGFLEVRAVIVAKKLGKNTPFLHVDLGSDAARPCGGGGITVATYTGGRVGR